MDWLLHNPIADLDGPGFLFFYAVFVLAAIVVARLQIGGADRSTALPAPPVSTERDPSEVAFLRGAGNELLRFTVFDLIRQGYLSLVSPATKKESPRIERAPQQVDVGRLSPLQAQVYDFYEAPHTSDELWQSALPAAAASYGTATYAPRLTAAQFYTSDEARAVARRVRVYCILAIVALTGLRLFEAALKHHRNIGFLLAFTIVAVVLVVAFTRIPLLSRRGRSYLLRLQTALCPMRPAPVAAGAGALPIFVAAAGIGALAGTEFAPINQMFGKHAATSSSGGSCSGSCGFASDGGSSGGSCSSSGGDGGGGGGCGG